MIRSCCEVRFRWLRGPAISEIDSPHLRGGGCLIAQFHRLWTLVTSSHGNWVGMGLGIFRENGNRTGCPPGPHSIELSSLEGETRRRLFRPAARPSMVDT